MNVMTLWSEANAPTTQLWMMLSAYREITRSSVCPSGLIQIRVASSQRHPTDLRNRPVLFPASERHYTAPKSFILNGLSTYAGLLWSNPLHQPQIYGTVYARYGHRSAASDFIDSNKISTSTRNKIKSWKLYPHPDNCRWSVHVSTD